MTIPNDRMIRRFVVHPAFAIVGTVLWGLLEFIALQRARMAQRR